jgi:hypothetical protein
MHVSKYVVGIRMDMFAVDRYLDKKHNVVHIPIYVFTQGIRNSVIKLQLIGRVKLFVNFWYWKIK